MPQKVNPPYCIIVTGRPGSGKTTLSPKLGEQLHLPVISRDAIKEGYVISSGLSHAELPDDANWKATEAFFKSVELLLKSGVSVIVEAAFQHRVWSAVVPDWIQLSRTRILVCTPSPELCSKRQLERAQSDSSIERFHGDTSASQFQKTGELPPVGDYTAPNFECPLLNIDTQEGYQPSIGEIVDWLQVAPTLEQPSPDQK